MKLTPEQILACENAARPLIQWLNENAHPHVKVIVESDGLEIVEGLATAKVHDYLKD